MQKILVIEDEAQVCRNILALLKAEGFEAVSAANGEIGLLLAQAQLPDLILCDVMLPKLDGFHVMETLKADPTTARIPVIFLTGKSDRASWRRGMTLGAEDYLTKPFTMPELKQTIMARLAKQQLAKQEWETPSQLPKRQKTVIQPDIRQLDYEKPFRKVFQEGPLGMALVDLNYRFFKLNHRFCQMLGYSEAELQQLTFPDITHPDDLNVDLQLVEQLEGGHIPHYHIEKRYLKKNGEIVWVQLTVSIIRDANQQPLYFLVTIEDINIRKGMQRALQESERRCRAIFNQTLDFMAVLSPQGTVLECNQTALELGGIALDSVLDRRFWKTPWWSNLPETQTQLQSAIKAAAQGSSIRSEIAAIAAQDRRVILDFSIQPLEDNLGNPVMLIFQGKDITQGKIAEAKVQQQLAAIESSSEGIAILNEQQEYIYVNQAQVELFGYQSAEELLGKSWRALYSTADSDRIEREIFPMLVQEGKWQGEVTAKRRNGATFDLEISLNWIDEGAIVCICRDITRRKQADSEVRTALANEKELNEIKNRFISMTSHEFRNPLSSILMSAEMLKIYGYKWPEEKKQKHFNRIETCTKKLTHLLDEILLIGRANSGKLTLTLDRFDLEEVCAHLVEEFEPKAAEKNSKLAFRFAGERKDATMDGKLLEHILGNLLSNAIKYTPEGGAIAFEVEVKLTESEEKEPENWAIFRISDSGIGIPPEDQKRLFETFHRAKNVGNISGTGLGLAIVKQCVDLHGGKISVESEVGVGTKFTVQLPLQV